LEDRRCWLCYHRSQRKALQNGQKKFQFRHWYESRHGSRCTTYTVNLEEMTQQSGDNKKIRQIRVLLGAH